MKNWIKKVLKFLGKTILVLLVLLFLLFAFVWVTLKFPAVQNYLVDKATHFVSSKTGTRVELGSINIAFPKSLVLDRVFLEDESKDTLLSVGQLEIDIDMWALIDHKVEVNYLGIKNLVGHLKRDRQSNQFNFQFLIEAFASKKDKEPTLDDSTSSPWTIGAEKIAITNSRFLMQDSVGGIYLSTFLAELEVEVDKLDLEEKGVEIDKALISGLQVNLQQGKSLALDTASSEGTGWDKVKLGHVAVDHVRFDYQSLVDSTHLFADLGTAELDKALLSLVQETVRLENFELQGTTAKIALRKDPYTLEPAIVDTVKKVLRKGWSVEAGRIYFHQNAFAFDYSHVPLAKTGIDYNHLDVRGFSTEIKDAYYQGLNIQAQVKQLQVQEKNSGFGITSMKAELKMDSSQIDIKKMDLFTNHSHIGHTLHASYASLDQIATTLNAEVNLQNTKLAVEELFLFAPQLKDNSFLSKNFRRKILVNLQAKGSMASMRISQMDIRTADSTRIRARGTVRNVNNPNRLFLDLDVQQVFSTSRDLKAILPDSTLPLSIELPSFISISGHHTGSMSDFVTQLQLQSSLGEARLHVELLGLSGKRPSYDIQLQTPAFELGKLIKQSAFGKLDGEVSLKGSGFDKNTAKAEGNVHLRTIRFQEYVYRDIKLDANVNKGQAYLYASVNDTNVAFRLNGELGFLENQEYIKAHVNLLGLDLYQMHLQKAHMQVSAMADIELKGNAMSNLDGHLDARNIIIVKENKEYKIDSLVMVSFNDSGRSGMEVSSSLIAAKFSGNMDLLSVGPALTQHFHQYFDLDKKGPKRTKSQNFDFELKINESAIVREILLPDLNSYDPIQVKGGFNSADDKLWLTVDAPKVEYAGIKVKETKFIIDSDKDKMSYDLNLASFQNGTIDLEASSLNGHIRSDSIAMNLQIKDSTIGNKLLLSAWLTKEANERFKFAIAPGGLSISDKKWEVDKDNFIDFGKHYLYVNRFGIKREHQSIMAQSSSSAPNANLSIKIEKFHLHTLSRLIERHDSLFKGTVNGEAKLMNYQQQLAFTSDISFTQLAYKTSNIGNLYIKADNLTANRYTMTAHIDGMDNNVDIGGYLSTEGGKSNLDMKVDLHALQLNSIESFTQGQIRGSSGLMKGGFKVTGDPSEPTIDGNLVFVEARTKVAFLNGHLYMKNETIDVSNKGVHFPEFTVRDTLNNTAVIDGWVYMEKFKDYRFDLHLTTNDFLLLNTTVIQNKMYYGKVIVDSDINMKGTPALPIITARVALVGGSYFTYTIPESKMVVDRGDGVMEFLFDPNDRHPIMMRRAAELPQASALKGMDVKANIKVDSKTGFKILIDPTTGDSLVVRGDADLNFAMDPSGKMSLSGIYELSSGKYRANIENVIPKEFLLEKGSKIIWNGEPLDALVDITARYDVKTSSRALMTIGNTGMAITDSSALSRPLLFNVYLMMRGQLLKPVISFKLGMPENQRSAGGGAIYSKINEINGQEAELNKQVFSLLVLGSFMSSTPIGGGGGASSFARSSVSKMMTDQLNQLSTKYLKGVELEVDLQSYNSGQGGKSQTNTQVNVGVKKSFNRLTVQVGSNVYLQGQNANKQNNTQSLTGDVQLSYKLTEDGRYQLKGFRQNQVDGVVNGIVIETGVGLLYNRNFTTSKELFASPKKEDKK